jgi:malonyl-CoA/methylmalonyl-CoA synthetase
MPKFDAKDVIASLPAATVMMGVPTFYTRLLAEPTFTRDASGSIRLFVSGSAPLREETFHAFRARIGQPILERYGMTETGMITSNPLDGVRAAGTVGRPLPGISVRVTSDDGRPCAAGVVGGVEVRGPNVFSGYWQMPEKTREEFTADGWFRTGDIGEWVASGEAKDYLRLVGRAKDLIISGGLNVYPKEIEERLNEFPGVVESAVIGVPDPDLGEAVTAVVVVAAGQSIDERAMIRSLKGEIATFKVPKCVHVVAELPRNAMGKVQKNVLRERFS